MKMRFWRVTSFINGTGIWICERDPKIARKRYCIVRLHTMRKTKEILPLIDVFTGDNLGYT